MFPGDSEIDQIFKIFQVRRALPLQRLHKTCPFIMRATTGDRPFLGPSAAAGAPLRGVLTLVAAYPWCGHAGARHTE